MKKLDHPNVMSLIGICWGKNFVADDKECHLKCTPLILLPFAEMGDLHGYLRGKRRLIYRSEEYELNELSVWHDTIFSMIH
jgi:hypothetical protein